MSDHTWIAEMVQGAAEAKSAEAFRRFVLLRVQAHIPFDSAIFLPHPVATTPPTSINKGNDIRYHGLFARDPGRYQPGLTKGIEIAQSRGAYLDTDVYSRVERDRLPFYADIVRPQGIRSQLHAQVKFQGHPFGTIFLCRHGVVGHFAAHDVERLRDLLPALGVVQAAWTAMHDPPRLASNENEVAEADDDRAVREALDRLSPRERTIATHVARGLRNEDIALVLGTSPNTVRNQLTIMYEKIGASGRAELAAWVGQRSLEEAPLSLVPQIAATSARPRRPTR